MSPSVLDFVQRCQVATGLFCLVDFCSQSDAIVDCVMSCPRFGSQDDAVATVCALSLLAIAFFKSVSSDQHHRVSEDKRRRRAYVNAVMSAIRKEFALEHLTLGTLARRRGLSQPYLSRALSSETRHSFPQHLNAVRVLAAIVMLCQRRAKI